MPVKATRAQLLRQLRESRKVHADAPKALAALLLARINGHLSGNPYLIPEVLAGFAALGLDRHAEPRANLYNLAGLPVPAHVADPQRVEIACVLDRGFGRHGEVRVTIDIATAYFAKEGGVRERYAPVAWLRWANGDDSRKQVECYAADGTHLGNIGCENGRLDIVG